MLCVLAVFLPSFFMQGAARALFVPLALAVGFAMIASYLLSSTFVPVLSVWLLRHHHRAPGHDRHTAFRRAQASYGRFVEGVVRLRWVVVPAYLAAAALVIGAGVMTLGLEVFPRVDAGRFQLRLRAPDGTRIEKTEQHALAALRAIEDEVGKGRVATSLGYVGLIPSTYPINSIFQWTGGPEEAVLRVALKEGSKVDVVRLEERLRARLAKELPGVRLSFEPADIVSEVMSFG
jgi:multidrug efflux pump subunit AcrB